MAYQPDLVHQAENSSQYYLGLDLSNQDSLLIPEAPLLTHYDYVDRNESENAPGPEPTWGLWHLPMQYAPETECIDPRLLNEQLSSQLHSPAADPGDPPRVTTVADDTFTLTELQTTHWRQQRETDVPEATPQNGQRQGKRTVRSCLKCRDNKKPCTHRIDPDAGLTPAFIDKYSRRFLELGHWERRMHALYEKVTALGLDTPQLQPDNGLIPLYMVLEDRPSLAGLRHEDVLLFDRGRLRSMLWIDNVMQPAISVVGFDNFVSKQMWPDHEQQLDARITRAQKNILETMRMFCGYFTLLYNLNEIKIHIECTQQHTTKLVCVALVHLFVHRLCHYYQALGRNLQALVDNAECNHYVVARCLEPIYKCLQPLKWSTTNHPMLQQLDDVRLLLNERIGIIRSEISDIERNFVPSYRGDGRLKKDLTMEAADKLQLPKQLRIHPGKRFTRPSTNTMLTWNGGWNMHAVPDLLSSGDIYDSPPSQQTLRDAYQPALPFAKPALFPDNGQPSSQTLQAFGSHAQDAQFLSQTAQANVTTQPSTFIDAELIGEDSLSSSGGYTWNLAAKNKAWWLEGGGASNELPNEFCDSHPTKTL